MPRIIMIVASAHRICTMVRTYTLASLPIPAPMVSPAMTAEINAMLPAEYSQSTVNDAPYGVGFAVIGGVWMTLLCSPGQLKRMLGCWSSLVRFAQVGSFGQMVPIRDRKITVINTMYGANPYSAPRGFAVVPTPSLTGSWVSPSPNRQIARGCQNRVST